MPYRGRLAIGALCALFVPIICTAQACRQAKTDHAKWLRHVSPELGFSVLAPLRYERIEWSSSSAGEQSKFSLWVNAVTTFDASGGGSDVSQSYEQANGDECLLNTGFGQVQVKQWRSTGMTVSGPITMFNASAVVSRGADKLVYFKISTRDSVAFAESMAIFSTVGPLPKRP